MHREELLRLLDEHHPPSVAEAGNVARARHFVEQHADCFHRELLHGHVTGSAWVVNPSRDKVLLMHHRKHNEWYQPGGHADGDADILRVALRETHEETGIPSEHIKLVDGTIFDVDIHTIRHIGNEPRHTHFDIRFLVEIDDRLPVPGNDESHEVLWVPVYEASRFNNNLSTYRMVDKTRRLHG